MATKFHISDSGMPGRCSAASPDSCPKTQAGDGFHGTLEEATKESQLRFEAQLGAFVTASKKAEETASEADGSGLETYVHPQGKLITVDADGNVRAFKDGVEVSTSATADKLRKGYGAWKLDGSAKAPASVLSTSKKLTIEDEDEMVDRYDATLKDEQNKEKDLRALRGRIVKYDSENGAREGRAYYAEYTSGGRKEIEGVNPRGATSFRPIPEQTEALNKAMADLSAARQASIDAQTGLEEAGLGHRIPDEGNTIRVRTQAQKWLLEDELKGQISDGHWENSSGNPWQDWSSAKVVVDPKNPGRNFNTMKDNYQLNASALLDVVGERMVENVQTKTSTPDYNEKAMQADLKDLRTIFKTKRGQVAGD